MSRSSVIAFKTLALFTALLALPSLTGAQVSPNLVPMFPDISRVPNDFIVTNRLGGPTLEFEILAGNIGGQDWVRPPIDRTVSCTSVTQYFRMPQIYEYSIFWYDPVLQDYRLIDQRRKDTVCVQDDRSRGNDPQLNCLQEHDVAFPCACDSIMYGPGTGNGVSKGWASSDFRGLAGQWAYIGSYTGDFILMTELDPDQLLQAGDLFSREQDATHDDNVSFVYFSWDGVGLPCGASTCVTNVHVAYTFDPVCSM
jgi:hypothetical protein